MKPTFSVSKSTESRMLIMSLSFLLETNAILKMNVKLQNKKPWNSLVNGKSQSTKLLHSQELMLKKLSLILLEKSERIKLETVLLLVPRTSHHQKQKDVHCSKFILIQSISQFLFLCHLFLRLVYLLDSILEKKHDAPFQILIGMLSFRENSEFIGPTNFSLGKYLQRRNLSISTITGQWSLQRWQHSLN